MYWNGIIIPFERSANAQLRYLTIQSQEYSFHSDNWHQDQRTELMRDSLYSTNCIPCSGNKSPTIFALIRKLFIPRIEFNVQVETHRTSFSIGLSMSRKDFCPFSCHFLLLSAHFISSS